MQHTPQLKSGELSISDDAEEALHAAVEAYTLSLFADSGYAAIHAHRVKVLPRDMRFVQRLKWDDARSRRDEATSEAPLCLLRPSIERVAEEVCCEARHIEPKRRKLNSGAAVADGEEVQEDEEEKEDEQLTAEAVDVLHRATEEFGNRVLRGALACAMHTGRETIMPKDVHLFQRLTQR
eukprot:TRINITY_DN665_c0_g1_i1.p1 TRINITY_DN665_c0_g1~~TRINITY_DN665_c0_g1_i1.p1  ORF type:complete len:180 (-),score=48.51 TRINITY_DN665_c0_g1_i1:94-633(-)